MQDRKKDIKKYILKSDPDPDPAPDPDPDPDPGPGPGPAFYSPTPRFTDTQRFPSGHGTNYFRFVFTFSFFTSKQLLFLSICFTMCVIIAKNIGLSDFEIDYKTDVSGETHATIQSCCITTEIGL